MKCMNTPPATRTILLEAFKDMAREIAAAAVQSEGGAPYWQEYTQEQIKRAGGAP